MEVKRISPVIEGEQIDSDISYKWVESMPIMKALESGIPLYQFNQHLKLRMQDMEFRVIRKITETTFHNHLLHEYSPETNKMNRYNNIIPYKHSIVSLPEDNIDDPQEDASTSDGTIYNSDQLSQQQSQHQLSTRESATYINANYINDCFNRKAVFIATQGPMKTTIANFWKMVWYTDVNVLIMLCRIIEQERVECDQYWPDKVGTTLQFGEFQVNLLEEVVKNAEKLTIRKIIITKEEEDDMTAVKEVIQYHWLGWPDHGVPEDESYETLEGLVQIMIDNVHSKHRSLVHCSAGVGRTGTILSLVNLTMTVQYFAQELIVAMAQNAHSNNGSIAKTDKATNAASDPLEKLNAILSEQQDKYKISIFATVRRLREQRWGMVYTNIQYGYLYRYMELAINKMLGSFCDGLVDMKQKEKSTQAS